jgi:hypothetical protein
MKNIFKMKSLLFFIMIMVFFTTNVVFADVRASGGKNTNKRQTKKKNKTNKNKRSRSNKKKSKSRSIIDVSSITPQQVEQMIEKTVVSVDPAVVYEEGLEYINSFAADETPSENSIKVGNYYIDIPSSMSKEDAENLVKNKLSHLLSLTMTAACNEQFNLGALALVLNTDSDYSETKKSNEEKIRKAIERSDFFDISEQKEIKEFIKAVIMLELKSLLNPVKKESYFSSWFKGKSVGDQIKEFVKNNHILNKVEVLKTIKKAAGLDEEVGYLVTSMAYYIKKNNTLFLESPLFQDIVHAMTIPLNFKLAKIDEAASINYAAHGQMREIYKKMLKFYDISNISGLEESQSAQFIVQSTAAYVFTKVLQGAGVLAVGALLAGGASAAKNLYYRDEKDKDKSAWDIVKEGGKKDLESVRGGIKSGASYLGDTVAGGYEKTADLFERKILRHEKGRIGLREEAESQAKAQAEAKAKEDALKQNEIDAKNAGFFGEIGKYAEKQYDSLDPALQKAAVAGGFVAGTLGTIAGGVALSKAGGAKAVFNATKTKGKEALDKIKGKFGGKKAQPTKNEIEAVKPTKNEIVPRAAASEAEAQAALLGSLGLKG